MTDPLLDDLDPAQRAAVTAAHVPLAIIAPAGSGKTRVLTRRIAFRVREELAQPRHALVLTFTRKAAGELLHRLRRLRVDGALTAGTFHAVALAQLRQHAADQGRDAPRILDRKARILSRLVNEQGAAGSVAVHDIASEIEWAKARMLSPEEYAAEARGAGRRLPRPAEELAALYHRYEAERRKRRLLDFDDVLAQCISTIHRDPAFAAAQQWRFRHLFVDEFQDTTPLQLSLLRAWLAGGADLSVVGDPAQAIYGFAGADAAPLRRFDAMFPGARTVVLDRNFRSTNAIVAAAEAVLGDAAGSTRVAPQAAREEGDPATMTAYDDDLLEAAGVAERCWRAFTMGAQWHDMAVLFRTNAQSSGFEAAFTRRGVPFRLAEQQRFLARPAVRVLLDWLRDAERDRARPLGELFADLAADDETVKTDDLRSHRDAVLELGREFLATDSSGTGVSAFAAWLDVSTRGDRARARLGADVLGPVSRSARRRTASLARCRQSRSRRIALQLGTRADRGNETNCARSVTVARNARAQRAGRGRARARSRWACRRHARRPQCREPASAPPSFGSHSSSLTVDADAGRMKAPRRHRRSR